MKILRLIKFRVLYFLNTFGRKKDKGDIYIYEDD